MVKFSFSPPDEISGQQKKPSSWKVDLSLSYKMFFVTRNQWVEHTRWRGFSCPTVKLLCGMKVMTSDALLSLVACKWVSFKGMCLTTCVFGPWGRKITFFKMHQNGQQCKSLATQSMAAQCLSGLQHRMLHSCSCRFNFDSRKNQSILTQSIQEWTETFLQYSSPSVLWFIWLWISLCMLGRGSSVSNVRISSSCRKKG